MARIVLVVQPAPNGLALTWFDGPSAFPSYELSGRATADAAENARKALGAVVECYFSDDAADAATAAAALAAAGYGLYQALFKPGAEQQAQANEVRKWLDGLRAAGAVESLEVMAEGTTPVPWNLVYDQRPDAAAFRAGGTDPARWEPFWGIRYDLSGGPRVSPLRRFPVLDNPRVVVVTDPSVIDNLPAENRELTSLCKENGWAHARTRTELVEALGGKRPDILYWLGHTQTEPFGLVLGEDVITPDDLKALLEGDPFADAGETFGGVAFLNACGTAQRNAAGSFLDALHPLGLSGYVATEQVTVDTFAAPLGRQFLTAFATGREPLGKVMRALRGQVPLGLLYGSYCPPMIQVRRAGQSAPATVSSVIFTGAATGKKLGRGPGAGTAAGSPLPENPYRSLRAYGVGDRALFAGRDDDVLRFAQVLDDPDTRLLLLHGESGVGKTSFLRAGVIPYLESECVGYRFARDRSKGEETILLVRATNDPVSQIAAALTAYCAHPLTYRTPLGENATADLPGVLRTALDGLAGTDTLRRSMGKDPGLLGRLLADLSLVLPFTPVLVIDQAEEIFTLARTPADEENRGRALEMLRRAAGGPAGFKIVVSLRTEYHGRFTDRLRKGARDAGGVREYLLTDFGLDDLIEVIRRPTSPTLIEHASEVPFEKYRFRYAEGVAEEIARRTRAYTINRQDSVLPLVQVICTQLYDRARTRPDAVIAQADLEAIGGVEGGMREHAEGVVRRLFPQRSDQRAFRRLLADPQTQLFIRQSDGTLTTALLPAEFLARHWAGRVPFADMLKTAGDGDWRLLRVNSLRIGSDDAERPYVSLGHDSLARVAANWYEEQRRRTQVRKYAAALVVMAATVTGLSALTLWALDQQDIAERAEQKAVKERTKAESAEQKAVKERENAEASAKAANEQREKAVKAESDTLAAYKDATDEVVEQLLGSRPEIGPVEKRYLENALDRWEKFAQRQGTDERGRAISAEGHQRVGAILGRLDRNEESIAQLTLAHAIQKELADRFPDDPEYLHALATTTNSIGVMLARTGDRPGAMARHRTALALLQKVMKGPSVKREYRVEYAKTFHSMGVLLGREGSHAAAREAYLEAAAEREKLATEFREVPEYQHDLARTRNSLGVLLCTLGERESAARQYGQALDTQQRLAREYRDSAVYQDTLADIHHNRGELSAQQQRWKEADEEHAAALKIQTKLEIEYPGVSTYKVKLARTFNSIGASHTQRGSWVEACGVYEKAIDLQAKLVTHDGTVVEYRSELAQTRHNLAIVLNNRKLWPEAAEQFREAIKHQEKLVARDERNGGYQTTLGRMCFNYAITLLSDKRAEASLPWFERAAATFVAAQQLTKLDEATVSVLRNSRATVVVAHQHCGRLSEAVRTVAELTKEPDWDKEHWHNFACVYATAGTAAVAANNLDEALRYRGRALELLLRAEAKGWADAARIRGNPDFSAFLGDETFSALMARLDKAKK